MKIRAVGGELFYAEARTGGQNDNNDEDSSCPSQFCKRVLNLRAFQRT